MPKVDVHFEVEQGKDNGWQGKLTTEHRAEGVNVTFKDSFCSLHPNNSIDNNVCLSCDTHSHGLATEEARNFWTDVTNRLNCERLDHKHDCTCPLGHDCHEHCEERQRILKKAEEHKDENGPNPFLTLAAEAPPKAMLGVYTRLSSLEEENAALKAVLGKVIAVLPEEAREALGSPEVLQRATSRASDSG